MAGRFTPAKGLEAKVAALVAPDVGRIAGVAADAAKRSAPPDKVWVTRGDELVRPEHRRVNGQAVPANLRFTLPSPLYDQEHHGAGLYQMGTAPRDRAFTIGNRINCRCTTRTQPGISQHIEAQPVRVVGASVTASVTCDHPLCVNAEFGNGEDAGARFFAAGLRAAAAALRT